MGIAKLTPDEAPVPELNRKQNILEG